MKLRGWIGRNVNPKIRPGGFSQDFGNKPERTYTQRMAHENMAKRAAISHERDNQQAAFIDGIPLKHK